MALFLIRCCSDEKEKKKKYIYIYILHGTENTNKLYHVILIIAKCVGTKVKLLNAGSSTTFFLCDPGQAN